MVLKGKFKTFLNLLKKLIIDIEMQLKNVFYANEK